MKLKIQRKIFFKVIFIAGLLFLISALQAHANRGVRLQDAQGNQVGFYQSSYALIVGANAYREGWPKLPGVLDDIKTVKRALVKQGFTVKVIRDPDHEELKKAFNDFISDYGYEPDNRLLFYFAGHGHTERQTYGAEMGYIVPVDAPTPDMDRSGFLGKALDMQQFEVYARRIQSKHALFLFDSCFSGSIFALSRAIPEHISYKTAKPVRQFITSGSADESVPDKSIFRHQFIAALDGEADVNEDGYITATELGEFLLEKVVNYSRGTQHPQYGKIRDMFLDKGDFVFLSAGSEKRLPKSILSVESNITGASVLVDSRVVGSTNLSDTEIMPGEHLISVEKNGYEPYSKKVRLEKGRAMSLYVNLRLKARVKGDLLNSEDREALLKILMEK